VFWQTKANSLPVLIMPFAAPKPNTGSLNKETPLAALFEREISAPKSPDFDTFACFL